MFNYSQVIPYAHSCAPNSRAQTYIRVISGLYQRTVLYQSSDGDSQTSEWCEILYAMIVVFFIIG